MLSRIVSILLALMFVVPAALGQDGSRYVLDPESTFWVEGSSNQSDWTVTATEFEGSVRVAPDFPDGEAPVLEVHVEVIAEKILSRRSPIMDRLTHQALKADQNPTIVYDLTSTGAASPDTSSGVLIGTAGTLTIAGSPQEVEVPVWSETLEDGRLRFVGSFDTRLTTFGMKPPSAMFGALHTADPVTIRFDLIAAESAE